MSTGPKWGELYSESIKMIKLIDLLNATVEDAVKELKEMPEDELKSKLSDALKDKHPGLVGWVKSNIHPSAPETGAMVKYNDKGDMVITMMTNAYMPKNGDRAVSLLNEAEAVAPKVSSVTLKDEDGNLVAKPGSRFMKKTYNDRYNEYADDGIFILTKEGKLVSESGEEASLDSTATYFVLQKPLYTSQIKPVG